MSAHKWGESPIGRWTLRIETREPQTRESRRSAMANSIGELSYFGIRLYGSYTSNNVKNSIQKRHQSNAFVPTSREIEWIYERELSIRETPNVLKKRDYTNLLNERQHAKEIEKPSVFSSFREKFGF